MTEGGSVVGVVDWAATSYAESGLEAAKEIIRKFKLHKYYRSFIFQKFILLTKMKEESVVYG